MTIGFFCINRKKKLSYWQLFHVNTGNNALEKNLKLSYKYTKTFYFEIRIQLSYPTQGKSILFCFGKRKCKAKRKTILTKIVHGETG